MSEKRGVAQLGRVLALGARCRGFESSRPDQILDDIKIEKTARSSAG